MRNKMIFFSFCHRRTPPPFVIPAFIAGTHSSTGGRAEQWVAGINPAMTKKVHAGMANAGEDEDRQISDRALEREKMCESDSLEGAR